MSKWQNLGVGFFNGVGKYEIPQINPIYELPKVNKFIEFDYCKRIRDGHENIGVHFFEDDYKFERVWTNPDRYGEMLSKFGFVIGPDFSVFADFPLAVRIYNFYRNAWLCKYWQEAYHITVIPTVMWGFEDTYDWCFDGLPKNSIVAVSNVGCAHSDENKRYFINGYTEMLKRLSPSKILFYTRNFIKLPGNIQYIRYQLHKGEQING